QLTTLLMEIAFELSLVAEGRNVRDFRSFVKGRISMRYLLGGLSLLIASVLYINAQTVDTAILGTVLDPSGAPVSGATVTIVQPTTGFSHGSVTSQEGTYEARYLVPGEYVVETGPAGFRRERRTGI